MTRNRLLVAHFDASTLAMIGSMVRSLNCEVMESGADGADPCGCARKPSLFVLGVDPGRPDPLGMFSRLRRDHPEIPIILLFSAPDPALATQAGRMGASGILRFPLPAIQLRAAVVQALESGGDPLPAPDGRQDGVRVDHEDVALESPRVDGHRAAGPETGRAGSVPTPPAADPPVLTLKESLEGPEREIILRTLERFSWKVGKTAEALDINRTTLYKKMKRHGIGTDVDPRGVDPRTDTSREKSGRAFS